MRKRGSLLLSSHEPRHTHANRSIHERHPTAGVNGESGLFKKVDGRAGVTTYQTEFIDIGVLAHVVRQIPVGHPRIYKGERRGI